jgi:hypothetical protein
MRKLILAATIHLKKRAAIVAAMVATGALACVWLSLPREGAVYRGRLVSGWVHDALDHEHWQEKRRAREVVISELRERAVPLIIKELRAECHSAAFYTLLRWQYRLPFRVRLLKEPEPRGKICAASYVLGEVGEPARPAAAVLGRSLRQSGMHAWEAQDVMTDLIGMGPVASGALPWLRRIAADKKDWQCAQAAFAIYTIEGNTNTLAQVIQQKLQAGQFTDMDRELFWFRGDEELNHWVLPMLCQAVAEANRSQKEREDIAVFLGEVVTTNQAPRRTLEALLNTDLEDALRSKTEEALESLHHPEKRDP